MIFKEPGFLICIVDSNEIEQIKYKILTLSEKFAILFYVKSVRSPGGTPGGPAEI